MTRAFAGFRRVTKPGRKTALTTGLTTDRKIFDFRLSRGIIAKTEYPGVVQLIERAVWDVVVERFCDFDKMEKSLVAQGFEDYCNVQKCRNTPVLPQF